MKWVAFLFCVIFLSCQKDPLPVCQKQAPSNSPCYSVTEKSERTLGWKDYTYQGSFLIEKKIFDDDNSLIQKITYEYDSLGRLSELNRRSRWSHISESSYSYFEDSLVVNIDSADNDYRRIEFSDQSQRLRKVYKNDVLIVKDSILLESGNPIELFRFEGDVLIEHHDYNYFVNGILTITINDFQNDDALTIAESYEEGRLVYRETTGQSIIVEAFIYDGDRLIKRKKTVSESEEELVETFLFKD